MGAAKLHSTVRQFWSDDVTQSVLVRLANVVLGIEFKAEFGNEV